MIGLSNDNTYDICYIIGYGKTENPLNLYNAAIPLTNNNLIKIYNVGLMNIFACNFPMIKSELSYIDTSKIFKNVGPYELSKITLVEPNNMNIKSKWIITREVYPYNKIGILKLEPFNSNSLFGNDLYFKMNVKYIKDYNKFPTTYIGGFLGISYLYIDGVIKYILGIYQNVADK